MKTYHNSPDSPATKNVGDIIKFGNPDMWRLVCKASSANEQWMKSTKVLNLPNGCLVQVSTQQGEQVADTVTFVPDINFSVERNFYKI